MPGQYGAVVRIARFQGSDHSAIPTDNQAGTLS